MLSDIAYSVSYEIQWNNFSSWLIAGGLVFGGFALLLAIIDLVRSDHRSAYSFVYPVLLIVAWVIGFLNSLVHAKDAWASMPTGLILRSEEHTSELQSRGHLVCRLLLEKKTTDRRQ